MSFFVEPSDMASEYDYIGRVTENMRTMPEFQDRYAAIQELQAADRQGLIPSVEEAARANGFVRVASLQGTLADLQRVLNPEWLKDKRRFYRWLSQHPQHCTYDRRKDALAKQLTMVDGKVVL